MVVLSLITHRWPQGTYMAHELIVDGPKALATVGGKREERGDLALGILASGERNQR
jgi:hypothetical protein